MTQELDWAPASMMAVFAHPDDAEFACAGTVAKWAGAGTAITYVVATRGDKGTEDPDMTPSRLAAIREAEQRDAGALLGVSDYEFMGYPDGYLQHTLELRRDITRLLRRYRPEVVVTFDPSVRFFKDFYPNHPDHRAIGDATVDAVFPSARDRLTFPELLTDGLEPHKVAQLWLAGSNEPNVWVDITGTLELKQAAMLKHPSQFGTDVPEFAEQLARMDAVAPGFEFAESFRRIMLDNPSLPGEA